MDRRDFLKTAGATAASSGMLATGTSTLAAANDAGGSAAAAADESSKSKKRYQHGRSPWPISLDGATVGWPDLETHAEVAAKAGYDAIEPWFRQLEQFEQNGGSLKDLGKRIRGRGLYVASIIGLWDAIPAQQSGMEKAIKENRPRLRMASHLGARQVQTIPAKEGEMDLDWAGQAYRRVLEIGLSDYDLVPALVFVEMFTIKTLAQAAHAAIAADHPKARIIPDTFHMYISGSGLNGLQHLAGDFIAIFQFNDAPADPPRSKLSDKHRLMPGDGVLDLAAPLKHLYQNGFDRAISVELYNPKYQKMPPLEAASRLT